MIRHIAAVLLLAAALAAQERQPPPPPPPVGQTTYRLEYTVSELEGTKKLRSRNYTMLVVERSNGRLRVGNRIPITGKEGQFQYMDVGVNIDARPVSLDAHNVRLDTRVEVTALASTENPARPILRNLSSQMEAVIPLDKTVILATQDEPGTETSFQVTVTARIVK